MTKEIDAYLDAQPEPQRATLIKLRSTLTELLPHAEECMKYAMPALAVHGKGVAGYAGFANHCSYFPMSGSVLESAGAMVDGYQTSKGGLQFPIGSPPPKALLCKLIRIRLDEISTVTKGTRRDYYDSGQVKAVGGVKDGILHGAWKWFRKDGSLMREGRFDTGDQVGEWSTWADDGRLVKVTDFGARAPL